jgi:hypothetical protein
MKTGHKHPLKPFTARDQGQAECVVLSLRATEPQQLAKSVMNKRLWAQIWGERGFSRTLSPHVDLFRARKQMRVHVRSAAVDGLRPYAVARVSECEAAARAWKYERVGERKHRIALRAGSDSQYKGSFRILFEYLLEQRERACVTAEDGLSSNQCFLPFCMGATRSVVVHRQSSLVSVAFNFTFTLLDEDRYILRITFVQSSP